MNSASKIGLLVIIGLLTGLFSNAQFLSTPISITATPPSPSPGEQITITAKTPTIDPTRALFQWEMNGKMRQDLSGRGKNSFVIVAGDIGSVMSINVTVIPISGDANSAALTIRVSEVTLTWSAETYVPKWYKGKALPIQDSIVRVVAVPDIVINGVRIAPENLLYRWSFEDNDNALVGIGKQTFRIKTSLLKKTSHHVQVTVEDIQKRIQKKTGIFINNAQPLTALYALSPLGGIGHRSALSIFSTFDRGLFDFVAEPFFFPVASKKALLYQWNVAGSEPAGVPDNPHILTVDSENQPAGIVPISVTINDTNDLTPSASKTFTLFLQ